MSMLAPAFLSREIWGAMLQNGKNFFRLLVLVISVMCGTLSVAQVDDDGDGNGSNLIRGDKAKISQAEAVYRRECSACHIVTP